MNVPRATYRLQFSREFTFAQAAEILDYLQELGISDVYASPLFRAGPESTHGYDVCCFEEISPNLGGEQAFESFAAAARQRGLGILLDMVPNHMGGALTNRWWIDVLRNGPHSKYADYFDIDWNPPDSSLKNKVLLPVLEDHYARVLEAGKLQLGFADGEFAIDYYDRHFPVAPKTYKLLKSTDNPLKVFRNPDRLHQVLQQQHYSLAWWRTGPQQINYRRFFDVTELVALRMERDDVFEATHRLLLSMLADGKITALRIDHPDGLWNPKQYFERLAAQSKDLYIVAEKILSGDEPLPSDWPVAGTTGYDFLNRVNGLFVDAANEARFSAIYEEFTGENADFASLVYICKKRVLTLSFQSEVTSLAHRFRAVAAASPAGHDLTLPMLRETLEEVIAAFPVYRTYIDETTAKVRDIERGYIEQAITASQNRNRSLDPVALEFLKSVLMLQIDARDLVMRFQQLTGPVMAKGLEDTAFYRFNRFVSLNDVGGSPERFGISVDEFHRQNQMHGEHWPHSLLATATHDTKRGEDVRARLNVLSEIPQIWENAVWRWSRLNEDKKVLLEHGLAPHANDEYLLYQTLVGAWPNDAETAAGLKQFRERIAQYILKAIREAKWRTSWTDPNPEYEKATATFIERLLNPARSSAFLTGFKTLQGIVSYFGVFNSLAQTLLKITAPGVPDLYQGTELWDFNLVDPDNRRPVNFGSRAKLLKRIKRAEPADVLKETNSGAIKLFTIYKALQFRREHPEIFERGTYIPLRASGPKAAHLCAFARRSEAAEVLVVIPRLVYGLCRGKTVAPLGPKIWQDTAIAGAECGEYQNMLTGEYLSVSGGRLRVARVLATYPVALLSNVGGPLRK